MAPRHKLPRVLTVVVTEEMQALRAVERLRALARNAGNRPAQTIRALLLLGIATAERDPAALANAGLLAREAG